MKIITKETRYALRALTYMALQERENTRQLFTVARVAADENIPRLFLRKLFQALARNRILRSHKGKNGGFSFRKRPEKITMTDIISLFQGGMESLDCLLDGHRCSRSRYCLLRKQMFTFSTRIKREFDRVTIASLVGNGRRTRP